MQSELKACPFCGHEQPKLFGESAPEWWVWCPACRASAEWRTNRTDAISAWNARAEGSDEITQRVQEAINSVDFKDVKSRILREYLKAGARRIIAAINAALKTSTGEGN